MISRPFQLPRLAIATLCRNRPGIRFRHHQYTTATDTSGGVPPYPYPAHANPTPHQIFHIPTGASQDAIKARYYELVKIYHPDSAISKAMSPETAEARFQAITKAYDILRKGKSPATLLNAATEAVSLGGAMSARRKRDLMSRAELKTEADEKWIDRFLIGAVLVTIFIFVYQTASMRREGIATAFKNRRMQRRFGEYEREATSHRTKETLRDEQSLALSDLKSSS